MQLRIFHEIKYSNWSKLHIFSKDLAGCELPETIQFAFNCLGDLLKGCGIEESIEKATTPTQWGTLFTNWSTKLQEGLIIRCYKINMSSKTNVFQSIIHSNYKILCKVVIYQSWNNCQTNYFSTGLCKLSDGRNQSIVEIAKVN